MIVHRVSLDSILTVTLGAPKQLASLPSTVPLSLADRHSLYYTNE